MNELYSVFSWEYFLENLLYSRFDCVYCYRHLCTHLDISPAYFSRRSISLWPSLDVHSDTPQVIQVSCLSRFSRNEYKYKITNLSWSTKTFNCAFSAYPHLLWWLWEYICTWPYHHHQIGRGNSQEIHQPSITKISLKNIQLKLHSNLPGANELKNWTAFLTSTTSIQ